MALLTQVGRAAACNRLHSVEQRASRWILQTHDRVEADVFTPARASRMAPWGRRPAS
jgi:hypothetical protein